MILSARLGFALNFLCVLLLAGLTQSCSSPSMDDVMQSIYQEYMHGEILMCELDGSTVFVATHNHEDASSEIFDDQGEVIMFCNWAWGGTNVPQACYEFDGCEAIYRADGYINGEPPVDLYGLGD